MIRSHQESARSQLPQRSVAAEVTGTRQSSHPVDSSPLLAAQRRRLDGAFGLAPAQRAARHRRDSAPAIAASRQRDVAPRSTGKERHRRTRRNKRGEGPSFETLQKMNVQSIYESTDLRI